MSTDGKCFMAKALKTTQLDIVTKENLHITMANHPKADLPRDIGKNPNMDHGPNAIPKSSIPLQMKGKVGYHRRPPRR